MRAFKLLIVETLAGGSEVRTTHHKSFLTIESAIAEVRTPLWQGEFSDGALNVYVVDEWGVPVHKVQ